MKSSLAIFMIFILLASVLSAQTETTSSPANQSPPQTEQANSGMQQFQSIPEVLNLDSVKLVIGYPETAVAAGIQGEVIVRVLVGVNGDYKRYKLLQGVHPLLDEAVIAQLPNCRFTPAIMDNGKPCSFWLKIPFRFRLLE